MGSGNLCSNSARRPPATSLALQDTEVAISVLLYHAAPDEPLGPSGIQMGSWDTYSFTQRYPCNSSFSKEHVQNHLYTYKLVGLCLHDISCFYLALKWHMETNHSYENNAVQAFGLCLGSGGMRTCLSVKARPELAHFLPVFYSCGKESSKTREETGSVFSAVL